MATENLNRDSKSANAPIAINEATWELLNDVQCEFQTATTLLEAIDRFLDSAHGWVGPCAETKQPEHAAADQLHAMVMIEQLRSTLNEMGLKMDGAMAALGPLWAAAKEKAQ